MQYNRDCRVGRYEVAPTAAGVAIYDMQERNLDESGQTTPLTILRIETGKTERESCLIAIGWLRANGLIDSSDYFRHAEAFMSSDSVTPH